MNSEVKKFEELQAKFKAIETQVAILKSKKDDAKAALLEEMGCKTVKEAYKKASELSSKRESVLEEIRELLEAAEAIIDGPEEEEEEED